MVRKLYKTSRASDRVAKSSGNLFFISNTHTNSINCCLVVPSLAFTNALMSFDEPFLMVFGERTHENEFKKYQGNLM